jgi:hypothetical protein
MKACGNHEPAGFNERRSCVDGAAFTCEVVFQMSEAAH